MSERRGRVEARNRRAARLSPSPGRQFVAIDWYCPAHPQRQLLRAGRYTFDGADDQVWLQMGKRDPVYEDVTPRPDGQRNLHLLCGKDCRTDSRLRWDTVVEMVNRLYAAVLDSDGPRAQHTVRIPAP